MAHRYPGQGYQPRGNMDNRGMQNRGRGMPNRGRGMPNRGVSNRDISNQGFMQNESVANRGGPSCQRLNTNEGYQQNPGISSSDMPSSGVNFNQRFQSNLKNNRTQPNPDINQGVQRNLPNRNMSNPGMNRSQGYQQDRNMHNRDINDSGFNNNQGYPTSRNMPNTDRGNFNSEFNTDRQFQTSQSNPIRNTNQGFHANQDMSNRGMSNPGLESGQGFQNYPNRTMPNKRISTHEGFQANQSLSNRGMSNPGINTNQGFHPSHDMSDRGMSNHGINENKGFQTNQSLSNRGMSNTGINTNQGFHHSHDMSDRGMSNHEINENQGFQTNQSLSNRGMSNPGINTNQGFQATQSLPNRDMSNLGINTKQGFHPPQDVSERGMSSFGINSNQGFQESQSLPNRGMSNPGINTNQGFHPPQDMSHRGMSNYGINTNQGFQESQSLSNRGMSYPGGNTNHGYQVNQDMPNRDMSNSRINTNQGFQTNQNIHSNRGESGLTMNNPLVFNQHNRQTPQDNFHMSDKKPSQGIDRFPMHHDAQLDGNSQRQMSSVSMQQGSLPQNTMTQAPIIQHVMIPVPVPVGTDIPPHLLRPQIITSSGQGISSQNQFTGSPIPGMQHQGQITNISGQFPVLQAQFQGHNQALTLPDQRNLPGNSAQGHIHAPNTDIPATRSSVNDLNYYIGNESRNIQKDRSVDNLHSSVEHDSRNNRQRILHDEMYENRDAHKEDFRRVSQDKFQMRQEDSESERVKSDRSRSQNSSKISSYASDSLERPGHEVSRKSSDTQMYDKRHVDSYRKHDDYGVKNKDIPRTGQYEKIERDEVFVSHNRFEREHKTERQMEHAAGHDYDRDRNKTYDSHGPDWLSDTYRDVQKVKVQDSNDFRGKQRMDPERHSGAVLYTDGKLDNTAACSDIQRNSKAILYTDGKRQDLESRGIEQYDRDKRKHSPVPVEVARKKVKRVYSPVSDSKSHGELKIHVSDRGRWIEGDHNLSPVSDNAYEDERYNIERKKADDFQTKEVEYDQASLDGAEMVSDSESYIGDVSDTKLRITVREQSPLSQHSSRYQSSGVGKRSESKSYLDKERVSPSRSNYSRNSEEKRSQSDRSRHTDNWQQEGRNSSERCETHRHSSDHRSEHDDQKPHFNLVVPDLCRPFNQKGCCRNSCAGLHVCKFFIIDQCKFGDHCSKGHDLFNSQSLGVLSKQNPGIRRSNATAEEIKKVIKERIISNTPATRLTHNPSKEVSPIKEPFNEVVAADPSFDARNYATGNVVDAREKINKKKNAFDSSKEKIDKSKTNVDKEQGSTGSKKRKSEKNSNKNDNSSKSKYKLNDEKFKEKNLKQKQTAQSENENMLSPVSGDEDDWEKYEKYEQVSDDGMSEKEDGLDNVSSDESSVEQVQVNRAVSSFPLPTAENIAVPIGMNDPLVFNRPLKKNSQSYIGPMNRPPPMFPLTGESNTPLFPVVPQNQPGFTGMSIPAQLPNLHVPNHLPSPDFMNQVIKSLPPFKIEPPDQKNVFKNDNNPRSTELDFPKKKIKTDKAEKEPELKETIKKLWKFPHKGIINMSIIEFVTETEAYKEEFIAEIVKILVTLELPYVTMKKLLSVIKEKVSINVKSEADMRKILEMYPNNFKMMEMVDSDDESDDLEAKKNVQIKANIGVGFCEKHGFLPFAIGKCECNALHLCKFYFLSDCPVKLCKFGHKLKTDHNVAVLKQHKLHRLTGEEILNFLADTDNRNKEMIPNICKYYIREKGCYKGDNTDFETICHSLHLCAYILKGKCMNRECDRSHSIHDKQPLSLLKKYGLDPNELGDEKVLLMLGEKCIDTDKGKRVSVVKQSQGTKNSRTTEVAKDNKASKADSRKNAGEGLIIVTHSETRLSSKYFVQNFKVPAVCKFYQNALGCRKKDWGAAGKCFFLHVCQHYVAGDCNYGDKCKRSHDLFSGQAAEILEKYNFDLDSLTSSEILRRLNNNSGAPVELPTSEKSLNMDNENAEITIDSVGEPDDIDLSNFDVSNAFMEVEKSTVKEKGASSSEKEGRQGEMNKHKETSSSSKTGKAKSTPFASGNVEDVIKHIMEHNKVDKK
ncbi:uncharacterized protein LOC132720408 isoform X2 [Ruditapes philippinarum]|uniref:uncharacterized protein LOC132720408 isoform X2 n=1 Tax=Ruditapes philippinarum TaxID=129788 RepID=UPI00295BDB60|nr:uncharacterized protein LOC132720408 isoform X2 [Ruditapes philippinarum]